MQKPMTDRVRETLLAGWEDNVFRFAAAIAFYTVFSMAPILLISLGIASLVFDAEKAKTQIVQEIETLTGPEGGKVTRQVFENTDIMRRNPAAVAFGIAALLLGSTAVFANLQASLNQIWRVAPRPRRSMWVDLLRVRVRSFGIVLAVGFLLLVSMVFSALISALQSLMADQAGRSALLWRTFNLMVSFGMVTLLFAMIYKYLPDAKIAWRHVVFGAAITSALFSIGKYLIGYYLGKVAIGSTYGAAGSFVILLIWIYYSALICFFGAEFTQIFARRR
ncbi:MAG TPA: YihY/virulence factor BrkB family protein, partial [Desulfosarcina sp.]|nr:YihY/virulence factor BrkB family protein [Desulfosarcina sp.]